MQHYVLLDQNSVYTAITRGRQLVVVVAERQALAMALNTVKARDRVTGLRQRLSKAR